MWGNGLIGAIKKTLPQAVKVWHTNLATRAWRNWQTRTVQVRMGATPWRFKSSRPHHLKQAPSSEGVFVYHGR